MTFTFSKSGAIVRFGLLAMLLLSGFATAILVAQSDTLTTDLPTLTDVTIENGVAKYAVFFLTLLSFLVTHWLNNVPFFKQLNQKYLTAFSVVIALTAIGFKFGWNNLDDAFKAFVFSGALYRIFVKQSVKMLLAEDNVTEPESPEQIIPIAEQPAKNKGGRPRKAH